MRLPTHCYKPVYLYFDGSHEKPSSMSSVCFGIYKIIVCNDDLIAAIVSYAFHPKTVVCCRPGYYSYSKNKFQDMAFCMGNLYAVCNGGDLFVHEVTEDRDTEEPKVSRIEQVIGEPQMDGFYTTWEDLTRCYLVVAVTGKYWFDGLYHLGSV